MTYKEIVTGKLLSFESVADFIPGVDPYAVTTSVELSASGDRVTMKIFLDPMHDDVRSGRMAAGWEGQLGKLGKRLSD